MASSSSSSSHQPSALSMASSSSSSSSNLRRCYHVFLSFRGPDVRDGLVSHLYEDLDQIGIYTFMDDEELRKGEPISPTLMNAIEESRIAIIVFSENYASSTWCLEELARIMECKEERDLKVFPVFYKVEPREVRTPREIYREAMAKHESKFGKDSEKIKRWKKALLDAGSLSGWEYHEGNEAEFIQLIVKELSIHLERVLLHVAKHPVGIDSRIQELISLSQKELGDDDVLMIGLWGPGGVGKTTLAKAMYNAIERQFQGSSFLKGVREKSNQNNGLVALQEQLLSEILRHRKFTVYSDDGGINLIHDRLCDKKILLVLDDVDQLNQLDALAGESDWFGKRSTIIVTSRDKHMLTSHGINCVYEVKSLDYNEALDLFSRYAFPNSKKVEIRRDLIDGAVHCADGLPLALQVFCSFLCGREEPIWESALRKLSESPNEDINRVLMISYEGLEDNEKEIFLDIACFFKGERKENIEKILDSCGFETTIGIEILMERSLITNELGYLQMHDLVQLMGKDIVNQECPGDPGQRSRLWVFKDVQRILFEDTGPNKVQAIVLHSPEAEEITITISPDAFTKMKRLRMLILSHVSSKGPVHLPNWLRWLDWCDGPDLEFGSGPKELVGIAVRKSPIKQFGGKFMNFTKLKFINFSECDSLASVPDLSSVRNLESLNVDGCKSLVEVHQSIGYLDQLKVLSLKWCPNLSIFPNRLKAKSLQTLGLWGCPKLEKFPNILGKMKHLKIFSLRYLGIKELPTSIENLVSVEQMFVEHCKSLVTVPSSIYKLHNIKYLRFEGCSNLVELPKNLEDSTYPDGHLGFPHLRQLSLNDCNLSQVDFLESSSSFPNLSSLLLNGNKFTHLPTSINKYHSLEWLDVAGCQQLQEIPLLPPNMSHLRANGSKSLQKLPDLWSHSSDDLDVELSSCYELFRKGRMMADILSLEGLPKMRSVEFILTGGEMPEWLLHFNDGCIPFVVPQDLYDKFLGLALCVDPGPQEVHNGRQELRDSCPIEIFVNGKILVQQAIDLHDLHHWGSDYVWLRYLPRRMLFGEEELLGNDWSQFQVCVKLREGSLKKCGFRPICEQPEDDTRVMVQHHQPIDEKNWKIKERDSEEDNSMHTMVEESGSKSTTRIRLIREHPIREQPESDSEEDNSINAVVEESRSTSTKKRRLS